MVAGGFPHPKQGVIMKKTIIAIIVLAALVGVLALSLAACDPKDDNIIVVGYTIYEPMNYLENNQLVGFDTELAKAVFQELGYTVKFKEISWENKYIDLNSGNIDCIWNGFTSNGDDNGTPKSELVDFSYKYMNNMQCVLVRADNTATTFADLNNSAITGVAESGSAGESYIQNNIPDCTLKTATTQMTAINEVNSGTSAFAVVDILLAKSIIGKGNFTNLKIVETLNSAPEQYAIGFRKGDDLRNKVNEVLQKFLEDGTTRGIAEKYGLVNEYITDYSVIPCSVNR